jgi:hypothetical protein
VQNLTNFYASGIGQDPDVRQHLSSIGLGKLFETLLGVEDYALFQPFVRISEKADAQRLIQTQQKQLAVEAQTPSGMGVESDQPFQQQSPAPQTGVQGINNAATKY